MKYFDFRRLLLATLLLLSALSARAQSGAAPGAGFRECATPPPTPAQWQRMLADLPAMRAAPARRPPVSLTYVPLKLHVVRDDNGTAGTAPADIYRALVGANERFAAAGVQFYVCGQIDYVDDSTYLAFQSFEEDDLAIPRDVPGTFNMYFVRTIQTSNGGACGYAYYPGTSARRLLIACTTIRTVTHELGHAFDLIHTHGGGSSADELVDGTNCSSAGDLVCDTPADPYGLPDASASGCTYTGTALDANGDLYAPHLDNLMSYWACQGRLRPSAEQMARAEFAFQVYHLGQLSCAATEPLAPTALTVAAAPGGGRRLTWADRATTELGYFVERAASASAPFVAVGYTLPNATTFTDPAPPAGALTYRVKPINAAGAFSNAVGYAAPAGAYCIPVNSNANCGANLPRYLDRVLITQGAAPVIDNAASGCGDYTYFAADSGALVSGTAATLRLEWPTASALYAGAWLDLNRDGDFLDANERILSATTTASPQTITFTVPVTAAPGPVRLRVRVQNIGEGPVTSPCTNAASGETEDYPLRLRPGCTLAAPVPTAGSPICVGQTLRLTATGVPAGATYTWTGPNGFTSAQPAPTIANAQAAAGGLYTLTIRQGGCAGRATTTATVAAVPTQPAAFAARRCGPGTVVLTPAAPPSGITYRWYATATAVAPLATGPTFTTPSLAAATTYHVSAFRPVGGCESARRALAVTLDALPPATLTAGGALVLCPGASLTLTAAAAGTGATYQFRRNGVAISGATARTYPATQAGQYTVVVRSAAGCTATSAALTLTAAPAPAQPTITRGPQRADSVVLTSSALIGNQWRLNGVALVGATARTFVVRRGDLSGVYSVVTTSAAGCASAPAVGVSVLIVTSLTAEAAEAAAWRLTPNPVASADGWLTLTGPALRTPTPVRLLDGAGRTVRTARLSGPGPHRLDVRHLPPGTYLVRIGATTRRVVVE